MELYNSNKNIIKNNNRENTSKTIISPNIYDAYSSQNNISREIKTKDELIRKIRTKKFKVKREEILKFKKIGEMLITRAKRESVKILNESLENAQVEIVRQRVASKVQGYKEGFEEGKNKALLEIETEKNELISSAMMFYENAQKEAKDYITSKENEIKEMIFSMVSKIIKRQLNDEKVLNDIIYDCIKNIKDKLPVIIKCSEFDYKSLHEEVQKWKDKSGILGDFHVVINKEITRGDFLIERNGGIIKYSVEDNLDVLKKIIFNEEG